MGWLGTIGVGIALAFAGVYVALAVSIVLTALIERRPVKPLVPVKSDDSEYQTLGALEPGVESQRGSRPEFGSRPTPGRSYAEAQVRAALRLGFSQPSLCKHTKGGIYRTYGALTVSESRRVLAVIRWGTTAAIRNQVTMLHSVFHDGRYLVTSDRVTGSRVPGLSDDLVLPGAEFGELFDRHQARLADCREAIREMAPENPLAEYEALLEHKARFLIQNGDAYWVDFQETEYRSTLLGALKTYGQTLSTHHVDRSFRPRNA